jgi:hypothetical protein
MRTLSLNKVVAALLAVATCGAGRVSGSVLEHEPNSEPYYRDLRADYVKDWYIFKDTVTDGILNPGDTLVAQFKNWWTPVSSGTHAFYSDDPNATGDLQSSPMNWATSTLPDDHPDKNDPAYNHWLLPPPSVPNNKNAINFYLSYSQLDNCAWHDPNFIYGDNNVVRDIVRERHAGRNGWCMGWVTRDNKDTGGSIKMDILIHDGKRDADVAGWGRSISNPQVSMSDDIDPNISIDRTLNYQTRHPAIYSDASNAYTWSANKTRMENNLYDASDLATLVASQELKEVNPYGALADAVSPTRTPQAIIDAGIKSSDGNDYLYQDAFTERANYAAGSTDGGMLAGLCGWADPNAGTTHWGDQMVIRIDIAKETLLEGKINKIVFHDFGESIPGSTEGQVNNPGHPLPAPIELYADAAGNLYFLNDDLSKVYFPENRIYIALTSIIPEPGTLAMLVLGALAVVLRRRRSY